MSVEAMARVWQIGGLTSTEKIVLLSLADHAGEEVTCYPSVRRMIERTGLGERAIQGAVRRLQAAGLVTIEPNAGKGGANLFRLHLGGEMGGDPRTKCTPARRAPPAPDAPPPHDVRQTPARRAPKPSGTVKREEEARAVRAVLCAFASEDSVASFIAYRVKHKSRGLTLTGAKRLAGHLKAIFDGGGDCDDALAMAEERGWASIEADWYFKERGKTNGRPTQPKGGPEMDPSQAEEILRFGREVKSHGYAEAKRLRDERQRAVQ